MSEPNPYQSPAIPSETTTTSARRPGEDALYFAAQCHNIIGGLGLLFAMVAILDRMSYVLLHNPVNPWEAVDRPTGFLSPVSVALMLAQCLLMLAGGISMHQHKRRWLAIAGAWAGISPVCGCYVFSLVSGIWALNILHRPEVKALFETKQPSGHES